MKPTSAHNAARADDARMIDDDAKEQTEEGRSALQAAPRAPIHAAANAEHKHSDRSSSMDESKQQEAAIAESTPAPFTRRSKRVREPRGWADAAAAAAAAAAAPASSSRSAKQARTAAAPSVLGEAVSQRWIASLPMEYEVDRILDQRTRSGQTEYLVQWTGCDDPSWQPAHDVEGAAELIAEFQQQRKEEAKAAVASCALKRKSAAAARSSPFSRLDADSLGVALCFLDATEFLVARLVSKQWHAASAKRTAWPRLQVNDFIRLMQTGSCDNSSRRPLVVDSDAKLRSFVERFSVHPFHDVFGKHANEVKLSLKGSALSSVVAQGLFSSVVPVPASQFQFLSALTLDGCDLEDEPTQQLFAALAPRLHVLILSNCGPASYRQVSLLTQLRVLVVDSVPPAEALRSLVSLQYFHVWIPQLFILRAFDSNHARVLRWLSANHALRSLSLKPARDDDDWWNTATVRVNELLAVTEEDANRPDNWEGALPAPIDLDPPLDFTVPARFTDLSISNLADRIFGCWDLMPDLRRLEFEQPLESGLLGHDDWFATAAVQDHKYAVRQMLPRLTELRVFGRFSKYQQDHGTLSVARTLRELRACSSLRRLTFTADLTDVDKQTSPISLPPLLGALSSTIEEVRLGAEVLIPFKQDRENDESVSVGRSPWSALAACNQLRVLGISFSDFMTDSFLRALSSLPVFHSLELCFRGDLPDMPPTMLRRMQGSRMWSALHLISVGHPEPRRFDPLQPQSLDGLQTQLANLQRDSPHLLSSKLSNRIRLYVHLSTQSRVRTYRIVTDEGTGTLTWESDQ